ncbi:hypothetical protein Tco_0189543 [Tanacetum coccineum]
MSYPHQRYTVYNILVNEEQLTGFTSIRRIHQEDTAYPCLLFSRNHEDQRPICNFETKSAKLKTKPQVYNEQKKTKPTNRLSIHLVVYNEELAIPEQTATGKGISNPLMAGFVVDSDPEEDSEEDHADYPADGGDDDNEPSDDYDDDDDTDDEDEGPFKDEEEEEHLAPADSPAAPVIDPVPSAKDTEAFEIDEAAPTHVPSPRRHTAKMSVRPQTPVPFPSEAEVERLLALPIPPPSLLTPLSSLQPQIPSPSSLHLPPPVPTSLPLSLSPLPPLPSSLFIPPVDYREDTSKAELPPRKRLCLTALTSRYEVGESSTAAPRPTRGHGADYGFIGTVDAEVRQHRAEEVGYPLEMFG